MLSADGDLPRAALPLADHALLWTMQAWVVGHCHGGDVAGRITGVYADLGAPEAAGYLDGFMWAMSQGATRLLEVNCVCCPGVSADERALLDVFALQQEGRGEEALELLGSMMTPGAALAAHGGARRLVAALNGAGHVLEATEALRRHSLVPPPGRLVLPMPRWMH